MINKRSPSFLPDSSSEDPGQKGSTKTSSRYETTPTSKDQADDRGILAPDQYEKNIDTNKSFLNFGPIARQFQQQSIEREQRARQFPNLDARLQRCLQSLRSLKAKKFPWSTWASNDLSPQTDGTLKAEIQDLVNKYFPQRSEVDVYIVDFKETKAVPYKVKLSQIHEYWCEMDSDVQVRWIHVPIGLGPLHSTVEDLFLHAGHDDTRGWPFFNAGIAEWPYLVLEVLNFLDHDEFRTMRDIFHYCNSSLWMADVNNSLNEACWKAFPQDTNAREKGLLWDLKWRTTHLGLKKPSDKSSSTDWKTLPDFWTTCYSDIPWQLNEGMYKRIYGPLDGVRPKFWHPDRQALQSDDNDSFYGSAQIVRDPIRFFHRKDGMLLTMSSMRGVNYLDRLFSTHLQEPRGAIFENDVASAIAFVRSRFVDEGTKNWPQKSVEWFLTYLITELGTTPHVQRQGCNAPSLNTAYQELIQKFRRRRDEHFNKENRCEPAKLIQHMLICKDELRRITIINKRKAELFRNLVVDLQDLEAQTRESNVGHARQASAAQSAIISSQGEKKTHQPYKPSESSRLPTALEMAGYAARKTAYDTEDFTWLSQEIDTIVGSVYELRSIQQREVGVMTVAQNNYVFILTIVLGVFVPFGAITSYWGMNLSDIQSTNWTQARFWCYCGGFVVAVALLFSTVALVRMIQEMRSNEAGNPKHSNEQKLGKVTNGGPRKLSSIV